MYCKKCGKQISDSSKFCTECGAPVKAQATTAPAGNAAKQQAKNEAVPQREQKSEQAKAAQAVKPADSKNGKKRGFFAVLWAEMLDLLKQPKKLIPTFVLAVIWLVMPLVTGFAVGANIPIVRFFCTLTYANGGVFGGFFGTVGGIFGKAVFAAVVNGFVLSLFAKKNPFAGIKKGVGGVFAGGLKAISPLLIGGGTGLVLYWFFNITSAPQNSAVAVAAAIATAQAVGRQNGLLFAGVFYILKKISKGKAPSKIMVSRSLTGLSAGFAIGFALTFLRYAWLIFTLGALLVCAGIAILFIGKNGAKKTVATAALVLMLGGLLFSLAPMTVHAEDTGDMFGSMFESLGTERGDSGYVRYTGHLTYSNGRTNKHGQPFPDLMDFNRDGYIDYADLVIQNYLVHNPDYADMPKDAALVATVLFTAIFGTGLGAGISTVASAGSTALSSIHFDLDPDLGEDENGASDTPSTTAKTEDLGKYISRDADGDLNVIDPATGEKRLYKANGDGTYTNPLTGATYTTDELKSTLESRGENADLIRQDAAGQQEWLDAERAKNGELSSLTKDVIQREKEKAVRDASAAYKEDLAHKYGVDPDDDAAIKRAIKEAEIREYNKQSEIWTAEGNAMENYEKGAEYVKKTADIAADVVATADKTGVFKDVYSATTAAAGNAGEVMAGNMDVEGAVAKTMVDASTEIIKNRVQSTGAKFAANIVGDSAQEATGAIVQGRGVGEVGSAALKGAGKGLAEATTDYMVKGLNADAAEAGGTSLTEAGETLASDVIKASLPEVEIPKGDKK